MVSRITSFPRLVRTKGMAMAFSSALHDRLGRVPSRTRCCGKRWSVPIDGGELLERAWSEVAHIVNVVVLE